VKTGYVVAQPTELHPTEKVPDALAVPPIGADIAKSARITPRSKLYVGICTGTHPCTVVLNPSLLSCASAWK
jgi:hypothetical protein